MAGRTSKPSAASRDQWAAQIAALDAERPGPITVDRIITAAFDVVEAEGFGALTMRRVAAALQTGPASLYAHVRGKAELDDLLIGELCARVPLPAADPRRWQAQITGICRQLRDQYLRYPGISRAALAAVPQNLAAFRLSEGMLSILLAGGVAPQAAAWGMDALFLYVSGYSLEVSLTSGTKDADGRILDREEMMARFGMLPADRFPNTVRYAAELTSGHDHERFDFTLDLLLRGLDSSGA